MVPQRHADAIHIQLCSQPKYDTAPSEKTSSGYFSSFFSLTTQIQKQVEIAHWRTSGKWTDHRNITYEHMENNLFLTGKGEPRLILHIYTHHEEGILKRELNVLKC